MGTSLERRVGALESLGRHGKQAAEMTDRELLAIAFPDYSGPMPTDDELASMIEARWGTSKTLSRRSAPKTTWRHHAHA
jgi:hypothetical protein